MISGENKSHQKHAKLKRPTVGNFNRNEVAILGTPCGNIKQLCRYLIDSLDSMGKIGFVDADHKAEATEDAQYLSFTDKITFRRFDYKGDFNKFEFKPYFNQCGLVLVNGNHFRASAQIVVIDPKKSLEHKMDRISNPVLVLKMSEEDKIPGYLQSRLEGVPILLWQQEQEVGAFIESWIGRNQPVVKGLVLAGGESVRMNKDKGAINYHGSTQRQYLYDQLTNLGINTFISCREEQQEDIEAGLPLIPDSFRGLGPMGALLSAFREDPNAAWLAVACDLPYLTNKTLQYLLDNRDLTQIATAFQNPHDEFPEPLITVWEPRSYSVIFNFLSQGYSCPRKVLINSPIKLLNAPHPKELSNVNHPEEYEEAVKELRITN